MKKLSQPVHALLEAGMGSDLHWFPDNVSATNLAETLAGMANTDGGQILLGISPRTGKVQGVADPDAAVDLVFQSALLTDPPLILPLPLLENVAGETVVRVNVPAGLPHVFTVGGRYLGRDGRHNAPMAPALLRRKLIERGEVQFEAHVPAGAGLKDLDNERIEAYAERIHVHRAESPHDLLLRRGCLTSLDGEYKPTFAAILLFGKEPQRWAPNAIVLAARFSGMAISDSFYKQEFHGTLPQQLSRAEVFVRENVHSLVRLNGLARDESFEYPLEAVRELLVNAIAHRDYSIHGDSTHLHLFSNRLEVHSPGLLPGPVNLKNLLEARFSRNPITVQVLSDMGFIERLGYGLDRVVRVMQEARLQPPGFSETAGSFRVALMNTVRPNTAESVQPTDLRARFNIPGINPRQELALAFLLDNERINSSDFQELCTDVHAETLRRDLADLVKKQVLLKIGSKRGTYYIFKQNR